MIAAFALEGISGGNAVFNPEKLDWFNQQHIMRLPIEELARRVTPLLQEAGLWRTELDSTGRQWLLRVLDLLRPRIKLLPQVVDDARPFLTGEVSFDDAAVRKHLSAAGMRAHLEELGRAFERVDPFEPAALEAALRNTAEARGLKAASLIHATRVAVTGRAVSPGLFEVLELLGSERVRARLERAAKIAAE